MLTNLKVEDIFTIIKALADARAEIREKDIAMEILIEQRDIYHEAYANTAHALETLLEEIEDGYKS